MVIPGKSRIGQKYRGRPRPVPKDKFVRLTVIFCKNDFVILGVFCLGIIDSNFVTILPIPGIIPVITRKVDIKIADGKQAEKNYKSENERRSDPQGEFA